MKSLKNYTLPQLNKLAKKGTVLVLYNGHYLVVREFFLLDPADKVFSLFRPKVSYSGLMVGYTDDYGDTAACPWEEISDIGLFNKIKVI